MELKVSDRDLGLDCFISRKTQSEKGKGKVVRFASRAGSCARCVGVGVGVGVGGERCGFASKTMIAAPKAEWAILPELLCGLSLLRRIRSAAAYRNV